jgi:hypothetical protein
MKTHLAKSKLQTLPLAAFASRKRIPKTGGRGIQAPQAPGGSKLVRFPGGKSPAPAGGKVRFDWRFPKAREVLVASSFNNWQPSVTPLKNCGRGRWLMDLALRPGRYEFHFVVDGHPTDDPVLSGGDSRRFSRGNNVLIVR